MPSAAPPSDAGAASRSTSPSRSSRTMFVWKSAMRTSALRAGPPAAAPAPAPPPAAPAPSAASAANARTTMSKSRPESARSTAMGVRPR